MGTLNPTKGQLLDTLQIELEGAANVALDTLFESWIDEIHARIRTRLDIPDDDIVGSITTGSSSDPADWEISLSVVSGSGGTYALLRQISRVVYENRTLPFVDRRHAADLGFDMTTRGTPVAWTWGDYDEARNVRRIRFLPHPTSTTTFTVIGRRDPYSSEDADLIPLPPELIPVLKDGVRALWHQAEEQDPTLYWGLFNQGLAAAADRLNREPQRSWSIALDNDLKYLSVPQRTILRVPEYIDG